MADDETITNLKEQRDRARAVIALIGKGGVAVPRRDTAPRTVPTEAREALIERRMARLRAAEATIPIGFHWIRSRQEEVARRVVPAAALSLIQCQDSAVLFGPSSAGKTTLACAVLYEALSAATAAAQGSLREVEARKCYRLGAEICFARAYAIAKAQMYTPLGQMPKLLEQCLVASILVIDDLGMDLELYKTSSSAVREILHERHGEMQRTIVTTNLSGREIENRYGTGIARRLREWKAITLG